MSYLPDLTLVAIVAATLLASAPPRRADRTVLALFLLVAVAIFYPNYEQSTISSVIVRFRVRDLLFVGLIGLLFWDLFTGRRRLELGTHFLAAVAFFGLALLSGLVGWIDGGIALVRVVRDLYPLLFTSLALLVPVIASSREQLTALLRLLATFSTIVLALTPLQIVLATEDLIFLPGFQPTPGLYFIGWSWAGLALANAFVFVALYHLISGQLPFGKKLVMTGLVLGGIGIVVIGLARMNWIALGVAILVTLVLVPFRLKLRFATALVGVTAGVLLLVGAAMALMPDASARTLTRVQFLFSTMVDSDQYRNTAETGERTSIGRRLMENQIAWDVFTSNPVLGAGLGYKYWENVALFTPSGDQVSLRNIYIRGGTYIHNSWLWLLSKVGLLGTVAFGVFIVTPFLKGLFALNRLTGIHDRAVVFGFSLRALALLTESVAHPYFFNIATATGLGLMAGVVLATFERAKDQSDAAQNLNHHSVLQRSAWHSAPLRTA